MLNQDYREILQVLKKNEVDFIVVGAYALAAHGYPRSTVDIDIWINPAEENSKNLYKALAEFGAPLEDIDEDTFNKKGVIFQIGVAPCRIDIMTKISGEIDFKDAKERCNRLVFDNVELPVLSLDDLIKNKQATGRIKDVEDAKTLIKRKTD